MTQTPIQHAMVKAWEHIVGLTHPPETRPDGAPATLAGTTEQERQRCHHDCRVVQAEAAMSRIARSGDVPATLEACQAWAKAYKAALQQLRQEQEAT